MNVHRHEMSHNKNECNGGKAVNNHHLSVLADSIFLIVFDF